MRCLRSLVLAIFATSPFCAVASSIEVLDHRPQLLGAELYTEGWDQYVYFEDGTFLATQFMISNFGPGDHRGLVIGTLIPPIGDPLILKNGRARENWVYRPDQLDLRIASHRLSGTGPDYRLYLRNSQGEIDLKLQNAVASWRVGYIPDRDAARVQYTSFIMPQIRATGRYRRGSVDQRTAGSWQALTGGRGFAVRYLNSSTLARVAPAWIRVVPIRSEDAVRPVFYLMRRPNDEQANFAALIDGQRVLEQWRGFAAKQIDDDSGAKEQDQPVPTAVEIAAEGANGSISGRIVMLKLLQRFDLVPELKPIERFFVQFINTPVQYRYLVEYEIEHRNASGSIQLSGVGLAEVMALRR